MTNIPISENHRTVKLKPGCSKNKSVNSIVWKSEPDQNQSYFLSSRSRDLPGCTERALRLVPLYTIHAHSYIAYNYWRVVCEIDVSMFDWLLFGFHLSQTRSGSSGQPCTWEGSDLVVVLVWTHHLCVSSLASRVWIRAFQLDGMHATTKPPVPT